MLVMRTDDGNEIDAESVLSRSHQRATRISLLDSTFAPVSGLVFTGETGYAFDGSVSQDMSRSTRRTLSLKLANPGGIWTPTGEGSAFYWDRMVRVEKGVVVGNQYYYAPQGVFLIDSPEVSHDGVLSITGADRMDRVTGSEFTLPTTYAAGTRVGTVIRDILEDAGIGSQLWTVDDGGSTLGVSRNFEVGEARLQAALSLATSFALEVYADARGYVVVRPKRDPTTLAHGWHFHEGENATILGVARNWSRDRFYNHVLVTNDTSDGSVPLIRSETSITDPANPLRVTGPMGDRLFKYVSSMITTQAQADAVAASLLWEHSIIEEEVRIQNVPAPVLEVDDAVHIQNAITGTDDSYAIRSMSVPLAGGPSNINVKKIRVLH